jgi:hypothetical protein
MQVWAADATLSRAGPWTGRLAGELNSLIIKGCHLSENVTKEREINDLELPANRPGAMETLQRSWNCTPMLDYWDWYTAESGIFSPFSIAGQTSKMLWVHRKKCHGMAVD